LDVFTVVAALTALSFFMYAPFYLTFVSPSQGIGFVGSADRSAINDEVLIYGMFVFIYVSLLVVNLLRPRLIANLSSGRNSQAPDAFVTDDLTGDTANLAQVSLSRSKLSTASGSHITVPVRQFDEQTGPRNTKVEGHFGTMPSEEVVIDDLEDSGGPPPMAPESRPPTRGSFALPDWLDMRVISMVLILGVALLAFAVLKNGLTFVAAFTIATSGAALALYHLHDRPRAFILLLGALAFGLVAMTEIIFLKDVFAGNYPRMNTVFKFYFQAWALLSITCGAAVYFIYEGSRSTVKLGDWQRWALRGFQVFWLAVLLLFLLAGMVYPIVGSYQRTNHYMQRTNSLDGLNYLQSYDPSDYAAIRWLNSHIQGNPIIVEAFGPQGGDYSDYGRISAFTGLPTLMGWEGHEYQWRVNWLNNNSNAADFYRRGTDINAIYTNPQPEVVLSLMNRYNAQYLYVGPLEQSTYAGANLHRFSSFMQTVYSANGVTIYRIPQHT
jgi:uncharacterized membrane protein